VPGSELAKDKKQFGNPNQNTIIRINALRPHAGIVELWFLDSKLTVDIIDPLPN